MGAAVLVVEDEAKLRGFVRAFLEREGLTVTTTGSGAEAITLGLRAQPDLVVLDLGLPDIPGEEVMRQLRRSSDVLVLVLTARASERDRIEGLELGADDYLTKPFSPRELVARVQAMLRRPRPRSQAAGTEEAARTFGPLTIDPVGREVWLDGAPVALTRTEFDLLAALSERPRMAYSRRQLIEAVWGPAWVGDEHLVDVHIGHLRHKLGDDPNEGRFVRTVRGVGYRMGTGR